MFIMTIDNGDALNQRFNSVKNIQADILNERTQNAMLQYQIDGPDSRDCGNCNRDL